jgi:hypothetical protein
VIVLIPMLSLTMGCDFSHPPSYMNSMIGFGNTQQQTKGLHTMIIFFGMWVGLIPMHKTPLGPLSLVESYPPIIFSLVHITINDYHLYHYFNTQNDNSTPNQIKSIRDIFPNTSAHQPNSYLYSYIIIHGY